MLDAGWHLDPGNPPDQPHRRFHPRDPELDAGHALCGPIAIRGAEPGMTLEVEIGELRPGAWGWTVAGHWDRWLNRRLGVVEGEEFVLPWSLDAGVGLGTDRFGRTLPLRPFLGVIGMPPAAPGRHSTSPPRRTGGNIDCKELVTGSRLFLPIEVPGGLLSVGDGHALQADGEVSGTAIECPMDVARLTVRLHPDLRLRTPRAETPAGTLTFGFDEDLDEAMAVAIEAMLDLMGERHDLERRHALALASLVVDLRITQAVNTVNGVHAILPHGTLG